MDARRDAAVAQARLAEASVRYADARIAGDIAAGVGSGRRSRAKPGEFAADELALCCATSPTRCVAWSRAPPDGYRPADGVGGVPTRRHRRRPDPGHRPGRQEGHRNPTLAAIDEQAVDAADTRSPKQRQVWLLRLVVQLEPLAFAQRHRRALAERGYRGAGHRRDGRRHRRGLRRRRRRHRRHCSPPPPKAGAEDPRADQNAAPTCSPTCSAAAFAFRPTRRRGKKRLGRTRRETRTGGGGTEEGRSGPHRAQQAFAEEADDQDVAEDSGAPQMGEASIGWRLKISIPTPGSCWAPTCNASTPTASRPGSPSTRSPPSRQVSSRVWGRTTRSNT